MNKFFIVGLCILLMANFVSAFIIERVDSDKDSYVNGDLVRISLYANVDSLIVSADWSKIDSNYLSAAAWIEPNGFRYDAFYAITFGNTKGDGLYNVVLSCYDPVSDSSSVVSYGVKLDNTQRINRSGDKDGISIRVSGKPIRDEVVNVSVEEGMIKICRKSGCEIMSEEDYEAARNIVITSGKVTLSNLTYAQLKAEIVQQVNDQVKEYINMIILAKKDLDQAVVNVYAWLNYSSENFNNQSIKTEKMISNGIMTNIVLAILIILMIVGAFFIFYLKTNTTWLSK